jgi:bifunctional non-homologous end joining protein LigD
LRRLVYVDHVTGHGAELFEHVQGIGAERIVSKRIGSRYPGRQSRDWRKTKCRATASFMITGFQELGPGRLDSLHVVEETEGGLVPAGGSGSVSPAKGFGRCSTRSESALPAKAAASPSSPG